jgi:hypothetical protein
MPEYLEAKIAINGLYNCLTVLNSLSERGS